MHCCLACPRSVCDVLAGRPIPGDQMSCCSTATTTTNTGMFTVMMRIRRKAGKLASAGGRLPIKGACARRERAAYAGRQAQLFWCSRSGAAIGHQGHSDGFACHTEAGRAIRGSLRGCKMSNMTASGRLSQDHWVKTCGCAMRVTASVSPCETCPPTPTVDNVDGEHGCIPEQTAGGCRGERFAPVAGTSRLHQRIPETPHPRC